jgi:hypothetical protein
MAVTEVASYISRKDLAKKLGERMRGKPYTVQTLIKWENRGYGPPVTRVGRDPVYREDSTEKWLRAQEGRS